MPYFQRFSSRDHVSGTSFQQRWSSWPTPSGGPRSTWDGTTQPLCTRHDPCCQERGGRERPWERTCKPYSRKCQIQFHFHSSWNVSVPEHPRSEYSLGRAGEPAPQRLSPRKDAEGWDSPQHRHWGVRCQLWGLSEEKRSFWLLKALSLCFSTLKYLRITKSTYLKSWSWILLLEFLL